MQWKQTKQNKQGSKIRTFINLFFVIEKVTLNFFVTLNSHNYVGTATQVSGCLTAILSTTLILMHLHFGGEKIYILAG